MAWRSIVRDKMDLVSNVAQSTVQALLSGDQTSRSQMEADKMWTPTKILRPVPVLESRILEP